MVGVMCVETTSSRACGLGLLTDEAGFGASEGSACGLWDRSLASFEMR